MRLLLIDGHYILYRSFFAIRGLTNSHGEPTNAIYGFAKAVRKMMLDLKPDRMAVIWDKGLPERRMQLQPQYKQHREEMPDDLKKQERPVWEMCALLGLKNIAVPNTEADDLIASYARAARGQGWDVVIATSDKDIFQMVDDQVSVYGSTTASAKAGNKESFTLYDAAHVESRWGVQPSQLGDVLSLTGDTSDNIPGVPGVGPKTAAVLIKQFGSVAALLERMTEIENVKLREKIAAAEPQIRSNREMVQLDTDLPLPIALDALVVHPDNAGLVEFFGKCEFKSLLAEARAALVADALHEVKPHDNGIGYQQSDLF